MDKLEKLIDKYTQEAIKFRVSFINQKDIVKKIEFVCKNIRIKAPIRFLLSLIIEIAILDCIGFIKHFLHFFHRKRTVFIEKYQELVLNEPGSSVIQPLKEAFLALRRAAETEINNIQNNKS